MRLLRLLEQYPEKSQGDISRELGVSLGAVNYMLRALIKKGEVKIRNFQASENKLCYAYVLTPRGIEAKARPTLGFLKRKRAKYDALRMEIASLEAYLGAESEGGRHRKRSCLLLTPVASAVIQFFLGGVRAVGKRDGMPVWRAINLFKSSIFGSTRRREWVISAGGS